MEISVVNTLDENTWRKFIIKQNQSNIFHTPEMFQVWNKAKGCSAKLWVALDSHQHVLALLTPVDVTLLGGLFYRLTTRSIAYGSVLCVPDEIGKEALLTLLRSYSMSSSQHSLFTELRNLTDLSEIQPEFCQCGFIYEKHLNYLVDLNCSTEELLQRIGSRTRKHIRRGLRKGNVIVEQVTDREKLAVWYDLIRTTYRSVGVPLTDISLFEAAYDVLQPKDMITFWLARIGSDYVAASAELLFKDVIYGWYGGVNRDYAKDVPGEILMWRILEWGVMNGYKTYDFGGAGKPGEEYGVRDFKAKFGGQLVCFGRNTKIHSPNLLRWSEWGYDIYQKILKRLSA
jgi:serine/alanine adding enzyme